MLAQKLLSLSIPVFIVSILIEWLANRRLEAAGRRSPTGGTGGYRLHDTLTDLGSGIGQQALEPVIKAFGVMVYAAVQARWGLFHWDAGAWWQWLLAVVGVDFCYYWSHRSGHRVNFLWAVHSVHHSSEDYNLSVALRQAWLGKAFDFPFYLPLALLGLPPEMYLGAWVIDLIYQFFIHAKWVPKLGPVEWLFNTPSHHRVHHGVNPECIDLNYGGIFIVFDRLFGTFVEERREPTYGLVSPQSSWNPAWANVAGWVELWHVARRTARWQDKLRVWFAPPEWKPADLGGVQPVPEPDSATRAWQGPHVPRARRFAVAAFLLLSALLLPYLEQQHRLGAAEIVLFCLGTCGLMGAWGLALEAKRGSVPAALASLALVGVVFPMRADWPMAARLAAGAGALVVGLLALTVERPASAQAAPKERASA
jgi:sterol desaturase/sphingolipid hydroxylase (fatty acid hydroxylase superfamily)